MAAARNDNHPTSSAKRARGWVAPLTQSGWGEALRRCAEVVPLADAQGAQAPERLWLARVAWHPECGAAAAASSATTEETTPALIYAAKSYRRRPPVFARYLRSEQPRLFRPAIIESNTLTLTDEAGTTRRRCPIHTVLRLPSLWAGLALLDETDAGTYPPSHGSETEWLAVPAAAVAESPDLRDVHAAHAALERWNVTLVRHHARWREPLVPSLERVTLRLADGGHAPALRFQASPHDVPLLVPHARPQPLSRLAALPVEMNEPPRRRAGDNDGNDDTYGGGVGEGGKMLGEEVWLFRRVRPGEAPWGGDAYVRWGLAFSPLALERTEALPAGLALWQPWQHNPLAVLEPAHESAPVTHLLRTLAPHAASVAAVSQAPPVVELAAHTPGTPVPTWPTSSSSGLSQVNAHAPATDAPVEAKPPAVPVEFRLCADTAARNEPAAWLLDAEMYARFVEVVRLRSQRHLDGLLLAALPELERWVLVRAEREPSAATHEFPGHGFATLPGCANVYMPRGFSLRPRINPSRLGDYIPLPPGDGPALFVPRSLASAPATFPPTLTTLQTASGEPFEVWHIPRDAFEPLREVVTYTFALELSRKQPVQPQRLLDESLHLAARTAATAFHSGLLSIKQASQEPERPALPVSASGLSNDTEPIPAATFRDTLHKEPATDSSPVLEPLFVESPQPPKADEARQREIQVEEAIAQRLPVPADPQLAPLWLELAELKVVRGRFDEALYAWASGAWLRRPGGAAATPETGEPRPLTEQALSATLQNMAASTDEAARLRKLPSAELLDALAAQQTWRTTHSVWLLLLLERLAHAGGAEPQLLLKVQQVLGQVRASLPYKVRWLLASRLAALVGDEVALEREREDLLGELNVRGISRGNLLPLVRRLLRRARASRSAGDETGSVTAGGEELPEHPTHVPLDVEAGPAYERATMEWPPAALKTWVRVLQRITTMIRHTGHGEAPVLMPFAEMLLTVSRDAGKQLPLAALRSHVEHSRAQMLKGVLREHLADFDAERQPSEKQRRDALHQFAEGSATSEPAAAAAVGGATDTFTELPAELRERISTYLVLVSLRWAHPAVREFWTRYMRAQSLSTTLTMIAASEAAPLRWLTVLGQEFLFEELLPKMEEALAGYKQLSEPEKARLLLVLDELARIFERRDLPAYLRQDSALSATRAQDGRRRVQEVAERVCKKVRWLKDKDAADRYVPVLKRLSTLDAEALTRLDAAATPSGERDTQWLDVTARMKVARAHHLCALGRRHDALELIQEVHTAWRNTYTQSRSPLPRHVRISLGWLLEHLLSTVPLTGNRTLGVRIIEDCVRDARQVNDARYSAQVLSTATRSLAQLGAHDDSQIQLRTILATAREQLAGNPSLLFEILERVVSAGLELLSAKRLEEQILAPLRQWLQSEAAFDGTDGTFYRVKTAILIRFAEWSLSPSERVIPALNALLTETVREDLLGDDPLDLAVYWAEWFLKVHAYEWEESIITYFETIDELVQRQQDNRPQAGHGAALQYLRKLTDHFIGNVAVEDRSIREFCRREESLIRDRVTTS